MSVLAKETTLPLASVSMRAWSPAMKRVLAPVELAALKARLSCPAPPNTMAEPLPMRRVSSLPLPPVSATGAST